MVCSREFKSHLGKKCKYIMSPIANMLVQLKNAQAAKKAEVTVPFSAMKQAIADVLLKFGFLLSVEKKKLKSRKSEVSVLQIGLKYDNVVNFGTNVSSGAIHSINLISKPSRRMYAGAKDLRAVKGGAGLAVVSTSKGVMSGEDARKQNLGGEVIFEIW